MKQFISIVTILCLIVGMVTACSKSLEKLTGTELLDLGEKYLLEMNYDEAIVVFDRLIEVEPRNPRGYLGAADAFIGMSEIELAKAILRQGIDVEDMTPENRALLQAQLDKLLYENLEEATKVVTPILEKIAMLCAEEQYEAVFQIMQNSDYEKISVLEAYLNDSLILETTSGKIGVYRVSLWGYGFTMIYFGEYSNNIREGEGVWFGDYPGIYFSEGHWENDKPNGANQLTMRYPVTWEYENQSDVKVVDETCTVTGNVVDGLWDGEVTIVNESKLDCSTSFIEYDNGKYANLEIDNDQLNTYRVLGRYVDVDGNMSELEMYIKHPEVIYGIFGFNIGDDISIFY